jgi:hypothetical protein
MFTPEIDENIEIDTDLITNLSLNYLYAGVTSKDMSKVGVYYQNIFISNFDIENTTIEVPLEIPSNNGTYHYYIEYRDTYN